MIGNKKKSLRKITVFCFLLFTLFQCGFLQGAWYKDRLNHEKFLSSFTDGEKHLKDGHFEKALESFEASLNYAKSDGNEQGEVECYKNIGLVFWNLGQLDKSEDFYAQAQMLAEKYGIDSVNTEILRYQEIFRLYAEGKTHRTSNNYQGSIVSFQMAIDLAKMNKSQHHELKCLRQLSLTFWELNDLQTFHKLNERCLNIAMDLNHKREIGRAYNNIGLYFWKANEYSKALSYYQEALNIARELNDKVEISACSNNIGLVYRALGAYTKAQNYLENAIIIDQESGNNIYLPMVLNNLGVLYRRRANLTMRGDDYLKALSYFEDCLELTIEAKNIRTEIKALNNIGNIYLDLKKYLNALMYFQQALRKSEGIDDSEAVCAILNNIGNAKFHLGEIDVAKNLFLNAINLGKKLGRGEIIWEACFGLGQCYELKEEYSNAVFYYKMAISVIDRIRSQIAVDTYKSSFARNKQKVYESLVRLLFKLQKNNSVDDLGEIFHVVESAKARAFLESLGESKVNIRERLTKELMELEQAISNKISLAIRKLTGEELTENQRNILLQELKKAEDDYSLLMQKIRIEVPEVANMVAPVPCRLEDVQGQMIDNKTALIEYFLGEKESYVFFITQKKIWFHYLPGREEIWRSMKAYLKALSTPPEGKFQGFLASKRLGRELLCPELWKIPESIESLIIIPDGVLYYLPFETLILDFDKEKLSDSFLVSKYKISYAPSSSSLLFLNNKPNRNYTKDLLALGNPAYTWNGKANKKNMIPSEILKEIYLNEGFDLASLPYSEREVKRISRYFLNTKRDIYLNDSASEKAIKNLALDNYKILHFACHAILDEKIPFRSALVLSKEDSLDEDGFLQVSEIYNLRVASDLVILSACQTGRGLLEKGEGVLGLPRIFFYSGAKSVVSALWRIDDKSTSIFMSNFYGFLTQGKNKSESLQLAKLEMLKSKYSHPFYWAAFILNGEYATKHNAISLN
jgi:CHAT domain-containing protein/Tfp pilus assembly protein PilF